MHIKGFAIQALIYSGGHIASRLMSFCLLPLTTRYLTPADYGIIGTLALIPPLLDGLFSMGFGVSMGRSYWAETEERERHGVVWTCAAATWVNCLFWLAITYLLAGPISQVVFEGGGRKELVWLSFLNVSLSQMGRPFIAWLQLEGRAKTFVAITLLHILGWLGLTIYFVVGLGWAAYGVILGAVLGQAIYWVLAMAVSLPHLHFLCRWRHVPEMWKVGYPSIFGLSAYFVMQYSDRYMLQWMWDLEAVGFYSMSYNFGQVMNLAISGFLSAWPPFYHRFLHRQEEAVEVFGQLSLYYVVACSLFCGTLFLLAKPVVFLMVHPTYHEVWRLVGLIALSQGLWGLYSFGAPGYVFARKTLIQGCLEVGAALLNLLLNFCWIPLWGGAGAAAATLASFLVLTGLSLGISHRFLPIHYPWKPLVGASAGLALLVFLSFVPGLPLWAALSLLVAYGGWLGFLVYRQPVLQRGYSH